MNIKIKQSKKDSITVEDIGKTIPKIISLVTNNQISEICSVIKSSNLSQEDKSNLLLICNEFLINESDVNISYLD